VFVLSKIKVGGVEMVLRSEKAFAEERTIMALKRVYTMMSLGLECGRVAVFVVHHLSLTVPFSRP
jgi:hypothetical protein